MILALSPALSHLLVWTLVALPFLLVWIGYRQDRRDDDLDA